MTTPAFAEPRRTSLFWGNMRDFSTRKEKYLLEVTREYGDYLRFRFGPYHVYMVNHPDDVHEVLVRQAAKFHKTAVTKKVLGRFLGDGLLISDGEFWKRQRRLEQPAFHSKRIGAYAEVMVDYSQRKLGEWRDGERMDINHEMMELTLLIVAKTLFDADVSQDTGHVGEALTTILHISNEHTSTFLPALPIWIPTARNRREKAAVDILDTIISRIISERRASGEDTGDLLSMLLLAQDEDGSGMTDKQVRDEAMTIFLAGHETTANAMSWTWYLLSQNPEAEARLHAELDSVLGGRRPTLADLRALPYSEMVIKEALRLYPPAWFTSRDPLEPVTINGYTFPAHMPIFVSPYLLHHDPRWWDEPERFLPERFSKENEARLNKHAYIPFGGGPRVCIGNSFAMMEAQLILATIAQEYRFLLPAGQKVETEALITLRPKDSLPMIAQRRQQISQPEGTMELAGK